MSSPHFEKSNDVKFCAKQPHKNQNYTFSNLLDILGFVEISTWPNYQCHKTINSYMINSTQLKATLTKGAKFDSLQIRIWKECSNFSFLWFCANAKIDNFAQIRRWGWPRKSGIGSSQLHLMRCTVNGKIAIKLLDAFEEEKNLSVEL